MGRHRFWSGGISNPLTAIEQMSYLIFLNVLPHNYHAHQTRFLRTVQTMFIQKRKLEELNQGTPASLARRAISTASL